MKKALPSRLCFQQDTNATGRAKDGRSKKHRPLCRPPEDWSEWVEFVSFAIHGRARWRLSVVMTGMLLAGGRRTVTSWLRAAGVRVLPLELVVAHAHRTVGLAGQPAVPLRPQRLAMGRSESPSVAQRPTQSLAPVDDAKRIFRPSAPQADPAKNPADTKIRRPTGVIDHTVLGKCRLASRSLADDGTPPQARVKLQSTVSTLLPLLLRSVSTSLSPSKKRSRPEPPVS